MASGFDGVEELLVRYGCLKAESTRAWRVRTAGSRILELSKLSKAEARTFMFDELRRIPPDMQPFSELAEILEQVTMGERPWSDLQQWCEVQLTDFAPKPPIQAL